MTPLFVTVTMFLLLDMYETVLSYAFSGNIVCPILYSLCLSIVISETLRVIDSTGMTGATDVVGVGAGGNTGQVVDG